MPFALEERFPLRRTVFYRIRSLSQILLEWAWNKGDAPTASTDDSLQCASNG
jgi:hypothetical protein